MRYILICFLFFLFGCNTFGMWRDDNIPKDIKSEISELTKNLFEVIENKNNEKFEILVSDNFKKATIMDNKDLLESLSRSISYEQYRIKNEFYTISARSGGRVNVMTGVTGEHDYKITYKAMNTESYLLFGYFTGKIENGALSVIYSKYDNEWKIDHISLGLYKVWGKDAYDIYLEAKKLYNQNYLIDAVLHMSIALKCLKPAFDSWQYMKEEEINKFRDILLEKYSDKYNFPLIIEEIETKPQIKSIIPQRIDEGYFPMINYSTNITLKDTSSLSKECDSIHGKLGSIFPGLIRDKKYIFYKACEP